jgi:RNA polymerase sigma factor (TIGR02999 family)
LLDTTSLVHESYLRFVQAGQLKASDRKHFLNYAGRVMRSVIVDFARERLAQRRGGDALRVTLDTGVADSVAEGEVEIVRIHEALEELAQHDARLVQVVEMRYFGGLSEAEIAESLGVHVRTVRRDWEKARLLLADALGLP